MIMIMINHALDYLSTAIFRSTGCNYILCVKVSEACFYRNMHDLLHTSTSCHFKICLKSHTTGTTARGDPSYCGVLGHIFIQCLCRRWNEGSLYNSLTVSGAHGFGGLSVISLLQILEPCNLTD